MEPPIPSGTILQNRYHLLSVLGQGGFGRTYLAEDQGRFNELCALKELIPPEIGAYALEKSKELFQREATTLYQIKHPQVPQFRANFEQDGRLFLVQDYVEGKTYREQLNERKAQTRIQSADPDLGIPAPGRGASTDSGVFSETEIRQLLVQLLPVLDHVHSKGIIHRDITPDNIILRNTDSMPVLIDFGVVKELATRFHSPNASAPVTTVGKVGYAPSEQIQTGRAYPSSDLYSLAVTALVLLTGKEPQALYEDNQLSWNWRQWANVSDELANVLNRMLSHRPGDRYQSATEVLQALQPGTSTPQPPVPTPPPPQRPDPNLSQVATMAVGRRAEPDGYSPPRSPGRDDRVIATPTSRSMLDNPWAVVGIGTLLALLAGLGSWALVSTLSKQDPQPSVTATPTFDESPLPTPSETLIPTPIPTVTPTTTPTTTPTETPTQPPRPTTFSQRLNLGVGQALSRTGNLKANSTINYIIRGEQDQRLRASLASEGVLMTVLGPDQNPVNNGATRVTQWQGTLPFNGDYTIQLSPVKGLSDSDYQLALSIANPASPSPSPTTTTSPSPSPSPTTTPDYRTERVNFPNGQGSVELRGQSSPTQARRYLVNVEKGQQLTVQVPPEVGVSVDVRAPNGQVVADASRVKFWQGPAISSGEYQIDVIAPKPTTYRLNMGVQNSQ
jgi:serine/threonine-protein kinase